MATTKSRIQLKSDTEANWNKAIHFIPLRGEVIIYSADGAHPFSRLKVGDGQTYIIDLPFIDASTIQGHSIISGSMSYWQSHSSYVPKLGEIILYIDETNSNIKIGDGITACVDLPFITDTGFTDLYEHINNNFIHVTPQEKEFWNNKINCGNYVLDGELVLSRN